MDEHTEPESPADGDPGRTGPTAAGDNATGATNVAGNEPAEQPGAAQQFAGPGTGPGWQQYASPGTGPGWQQYAAPGAYPPPAGSSWYAGHTPGAPADGTVPPGYPAAGPAGYAAPGAQPPAGASPGRPTWGAPPVALPATASQTRTRWKPWKKVAAGAALAAVVAVGGVAAVTAANASNESGSTQPGQGGIGGGKRRVGFWQRGVGGGQDAARAVQVAGDLSQPVRGHGRLLFQPGEQPAHHDRSLPFRPGSASATARGPPGRHPPAYDGLGTSRGNGRAGRTSAGRYDWLAGTLLPTRGAFRCVP